MLTSLQINMDIECLNFELLRLNFSFWRVLSSEIIRLPPAHLEERKFQPLSLYLFDKFIIDRLQRWFEFLLNKNK